MVVWGTGKRKREVLHIDDMAAASLLVFDLPHEQYEANTHHMPNHINVGHREDDSTRELSHPVGRVTSFEDNIIPDPSKPDGIMRKLMDVSRLKDLGWAPAISPEQGVKENQRWLLVKVEAARP